MKLKQEAYAKINLSLDIVGKRADGYHLLRTVMQSVSLFDTVFAEKAEGITLRCDLPGIPTDRRNTAYRAAEVFFAHTGITDGVKLSVEQVMHIDQLVYGLENIID